MNLLLDRLPTEYEGLKIETNFRSFILFELLMQDVNVEDNDKVALAINLFYKEMPDNLEKAINGILWFYSCGKEHKENTKKHKEEHKERIYSYEHDADMIYSAFLSQYKIDLNKVKYLHWFKFRALFECLNDENKICQVMSYRAVDLNKIKDKEQQKKYKKLKQQWALPDERNEEEKEQDFADMLW